MFDKDSFHLTWEDNLPYDEPWYRDNYERLQKFVQYYESCKEVKRNKHPNDSPETRRIQRKLEDQRRTQNRDDIET